MTSEWPKSRAPMPPNVGEDVKPQELSLLTERHGGIIMWTKVVRYNS